MSALAIMWCAMNPTRATLYQPLWSWRNRWYKCLLLPLPSGEGRGEQLSCLSRGPCMLGDRHLPGLPALQIADHGVHDGQQLMQAGRQGNLLGFARGQQALVKGFDHGIVARG